MSYSSWNCTSISFLESVSSNLIFHSMVDSFNGIEILYLKIFEIMLIRVLQPYLSSSILKNINHEMIIKFIILDKLNNLRISKRLTYKKILWYLWKQLSEDNTVGSLITGTSDSLIMIYYLFPNTSSVINSIPFEVIASFVEIKLKSLLWHLLTWAKI